MTASATDTPENTLLADPSAGIPKKPQPVLLRSIHDYSLTQRALEVRVEDLKGLAKKNTAEGYTREARAVQADADAIAHHIIPAFQAQRELPLVTHEQLEKEISGALSVIVARGFDGLAGSKVIVSAENVISRRKSLLAELTKRITLYAKTLADDAFNQGVAARGQSSEALAIGAISTLRASGED